jgi:hypothetical protein
MGTSSSAPSARPARLPAMRGGRPLKAWTWVGAFGPDLMLCAARVRIGVLPVAWWALWDRGGGRMIARDARGRGGVELSPTRLRVRGRAVEIDLEIGSGAPVEVSSPHGTQRIWTRKRAGVTARGRIAIDGVRRDVELRAVVDESAGYHARRTAWRWSAGVGTSASGAAVAWNLVDGLHDGPERSERAVWLDGEPHAVGPATFATDLSWVAADGQRLGFTREALRARSERIGPIASDYEAPFGSFAGSLPLAGRLHEGWGVMERHEALW